MTWLRDDGLGSVIARGASGAFLVRTAGMGLVFLLHLLLARVLKAEEYGLYIYALSWLNTCLLFAILGWDGGSVRLVAAYAAQEKWQLLRGVLVSGRRIVLLASIVVSGVVAIVVWILWDRIEAKLALVFLAGCLVLPLNAQIQLGGACLRGYKKVIKASVPQSILRPTILASAVVLSFVIFGYPATAVGTMFLSAIAGIAALILTSVWLSKSLPVEAQSVSPQRRVKEWSIVALPMLFTSGSHVLMRHIDILMLGFFVGPTQAGIYAVASRVADLVAFGHIAGNTVMAPVISSLYARDQMTELQSAVTLTTVGVSIFTFVLAAAMLFLNEFVLGLFGDDFEIGSTALIILVFAHVLKSISGPVGYLMTMTGHEVNAALLLTLGAILNAILNAILIPSYGIEGAATATALSIVFWNFLMVWYVRYRLKIFSTAFSYFAPTR